MSRNRPFPAAAMLTALAALTLLSGCIARTAASIVTAPVRVVSKGVDWTTTSQSESDEKRGRAVRQREQRLGKLERDYRRHREQCSAGDREACRQAEAEYGEMQDLMPSVPYERD